MKTMKRNRRRTSLLQSNCALRRNDSARRSKKDMRKRAQESWALIRVVQVLGPSLLLLGKKMGREIEAKVEAEIIAQRIDDRIVNRDTRNCSIRIMHLSQESQYKSAVGKPHAQGRPPHEMMSKSFARLRDQTGRVEEDLVLQIGVGKRVDFICLDYQPPPIFPAISMTF
jgi:hypothetical protein